MVLLRWFLFRFSYTLVGQMFPINLRSLNFSKCRNPTSEKADCIDSIQELVIILKERCKIIIFAFRLNPMRNKSRG